MSLNDICRLCLTKDNLIWIFDHKIEYIDNMSHIVYNTTGVEILTSDVISQKICKRCSTVVNKMWQFRKEAVKNDQYLKDTYKEYLKNGKLNILNTSTTVRKEKEIKLHPSVKEMFHIYPEIKVPPNCLKFNISPYISLQMDQVENYFKINNKNLKKHTILALRAANQSKTKKGESISTSNNAINTEVNAMVRDVMKANVCLQKIDSTRNFTTEPNHTIIDESQKPQNTLNETGLNVAVCSKTKLNVILNHQANKTGEEISKICIKRKLPEEEHVIDSVKKLKRAQPDNNSESLRQEVKSIKTYICEICDSVQYNTRDLKKHTKKHWRRCQFCKMSLRNLDQKNAHLENSCPIKKAMLNLPTVSLIKIDQDKDLIKKYAYKLNNSILGDKKKNKPFSTTKNNDGCIIELSDEEVNIAEITDQASTDKKIPKGSIKDRGNKKPKKTYVNKSTTKKSNDTPTSNSTGASKSSAKINENIAYNTVSIVKPDIRINNSTIIDMFDPKTSDVIVLKNLLITLGHTISPKDISHQIDQTNSSILLKSLKKHLHRHIPIKLINGPKNVTFSSTETIKKKPYHSWDYSKAIDVRPNDTAQTMNNSLPSTSLTKSQSVTIPTSVPSSSTFSIKNVGPNVTAQTINSNLPSSSLTNNVTIPTSVPSSSTFIVKSGEPNVTAQTINSSLPSTSLTNSVTIPTSVLSSSTFIVKNGGPNVTAQTINNSLPSTLLTKSVTIPSSVPSSSTFIINNRGVNVTAQTINNSLPSTSWTKSVTIPTSVPCSSTFTVKNGGANVTAQIINSSLPSISLTNSVTIPTSVRSSSTFIVKNGGPNVTAQTINNSLPSTSFTKSVTIPTSVPSSSTFIIKNVGTVLSTISTSSQNIQKLVSNNSVISSHSQSNIILNKSNLSSKPNSIYLTNRNVVVCEPASHNNSINTFSAINAGNISSSSSSNICTADRTIPVKFSNSSIKARTVSSAIQNAQLIVNRVTQTQKSSAPNILNACVSTASAPIRPYLSCSISATKTNDHSYVSTASANVLTTNINEYNSLIKVNSIIQPGSQLKPIQSSSSRIPTVNEFRSAHSEEPSLQNVIVSANPTVPMTSASRSIESVNPNIPKISMPMVSPSSNPSSITRPLNACVPTSTIVSNSIHNETVVTSNSMPLVQSTNLSVPSSTVPSGSTYSGPVIGAIRVKPVSQLT